MALSINAVFEEKPSFEWHDEQKGLMKLRVFTCQKCHYDFFRITWPLFEVGQPANWRRETRDSLVRAYETHQDRCENLLKQWKEEKEIREEQRVEDLIQQKRWELDEVRKKRIEWRAAQGIRVINFVRRKA